VAIADKRHDDVRPALDDAGDRVHEDICACTRSVTGQLCRGLLTDACMRIGIVVVAEHL